MDVDLNVLEIESGRTIQCLVTAAEGEAGCRLSVSSTSLGTLAAMGEDFEEAFVGLRSQLDARGLLLLCNRYRRDALATSVSRQMSRGLRCYLVVPRVALSPAALVDCLGPAEPSDVVLGDEAREFIAEWKAWFELPWFRRLFRRRSENSVDPFALNELPQNG